MDFAYLFIRDDAFLGFTAGEVVRANLRMATFSSGNRIVFANYGYLAGLLSGGLVIPLSDSDLTRLAGSRPALLRRTA